MNDLTMYDCRLKNITSTFSLTGFRSMGDWITSVICHLQKHFTPNRAWRLTSYSSSYYLGFNYSLLSKFVLSLVQIILLWICDLCVLRIFGTRPNKFENMIIIIIINILTKLINIMIIIAGEEYIFNKIKNIRWTKHFLRSRPLFVPRF